MRLRFLNLRLNTVSCSCFIGTLALSTVSLSGARAQTLTTPGAAVPLNPSGQGSPASSPSTQPAPAPPSQSAASPSAPKPIKLGNLTVSGTWRLRGEHWNWFNAPGFDNNYNFLGSLLRVGIGQQKPKQDFLIEIAQPTLLGLPDNAIAPAPQGQLGLGANYYAANQRKTDAGIFIKQAYVRLKGLGNTSNNLQLGRFEFNDGLETTAKNPTLAWLKNNRLQARLIGNFGFSHVQRSFDGAQFVHNTPQLNFTALAMRPTRGVFQVDGNGELEVNTFYGALTKPLSHGQAEGRLFAINYQDERNSVPKVDNRPAAVRAADTQDINVNTFGAHYIHTFALGSGQGDALLWGAWQTGDWGTLKQRANAVTAEVGYQPKNSSLKPWLRAGYFRGSGDKNAADTEHQTFFQLLPTPRIYARFPFFNMMNNEDVFAQLILRPRNYTIRADAHQLRLTNSTDLWYSGGGAYQPGNFGYAGRPSGGSRNLANLFDLSLDHPLSSSTSLTLYLAYAQGKQVITNIYPTGKNAQYAYLELTQRF
ncbi:MAG: alginate export family protein [Abitibacteriaceae bacterium]|nr:alginate export family protein [Abditibacteriaceae bacterium]